MTSLYFIHKKKKESYPLPCSPQMKKENDIRYQAKRKKSANGHPEMLIIILYIF